MSFLVNCLIHICPPCSAQVTLAEVFTREHLGCPSSPLYPFPTTPRGGSPPWGPQGCPLPSLESFVRSHPLPPSCPLPGSSPSAWKRGQFSSLLKLNLFPLPILGEDLMLMNPILSSIFTSQSSQLACPPPRPTQQLSHECPPAPPAPSRSHSLLLGGRRTCMLTALFLCVGLPQALSSVHSTTVPLRIWIGACSPLLPRLEPPPISTCGPGAST